MASVAEGTAGPTMTSMPLFADPVPSVASRSESIVGDYPWGIPGVPDYYCLEEVVQINMRIHMAGRALLSLPRTLSSLSSPTVNEIFDATCALISAVDRFASKKPASAPVPSNANDRGQPANFGSPALGLPSAVIDNALDSSICLMLHSCHQALLGILEDLSASLILCSAEAPQLTPPRTPRGDGSFYPPHYNQHPTTMIHLIQHLFSEMDRAFLPLPDHPKIRSFRNPKGMPTVADKVGGYFGAAGLQPLKSHATWHKGGGHSLVSQMDQRRVRVKNQVKAVERLVAMT